MSKPAWAYPLAAQPCQDCGAIVWMGRPHEVQECIAYLRRQIERLEARAARLAS